MATTHTRIAMDRLLFPLLATLGGEFGQTRCILAGTTPDAHADRWIDIKLVSDAPEFLAAWASLRLYTVRIRYIRRVSGQPTTPGLEGLLDQVERLKRTLVNGANRGAEGYWLDGIIGMVNYEPDLSALGEPGEFEGVEIEWTCKINEVIS